MHGSVPPPYCVTTHAAMHADGYLPVAGRTPQLRILPMPMH